MILGSGQKCGHSYGFAFGDSYSIEMADDADTSIKSAKDLKLIFNLNLIIKINI